MAKELFNAKIQEFVSDLAAAYPDIGEYKQCKSALSLAVRLSPEQPQRLFRQMVVVPFKQHILDRDEVFFIGHDFKDVVSDFDVVSRIRASWQHMSAEDKSSVWKYLQLLIMIDERC